MSRSEDGLGAEKFDWGEAYSTLAGVLIASDFSAIFAVEISNRKLGVGRDGHRQPAAKIIDKSTRVLD